MSDDESRNEAAEEIELDEFELDTEDAGDLEDAMQAALDAVEQVESRAEGHPETDVDPEPQAVDSAPQTEVDADPRVAQLERDLKELRDRSLRTLADFDNFRKRASREREEAQRTARIELLREILPIVDNLERALEAGGSAEDLKAGVDLILKETEAFLKRHGVRKVTSVGERFDPAVHEAVSRHEDPEVAEPTVSEEFQAGYTINERLLRPSIVKVRMPAEGVAANGGAEAETEEAGE